MTIAASALLAIVLASLLAWFMLWRLKQRRLHLAILPGVLALAVLWVWSAHFHAYAATCGTFVATAMVARASWTWLGQRRQ